MLKTFFGGVFIDKETLLTEGIEYPIKLEYFKTLKSEKNVRNKYGIEIVKTEYLDADNERIESKEIRGITKRAENINKILQLLKNNEVTPICVEDVLEDLNFKSL